MAIKNKDGSTFKLRSPNPVMKNQKVWQDYKVHNLKFSSEINEDHTELNPVISDFSDKDFVAELEISKPIVEEITKTLVIPDKDREEKKQPVQKTIMHCLPAIVRDHKDPLYGEKYKTIHYNKPFTFEGVIIENNDINFRFWAMVPQLAIGSVVYPKTQEKRWWRVIDRSEKNGGWIVEAVPSDYQPTFKS